MGNEQSTPLAGGVVAAGAPAAATPPNTLTQEEKAARFAAELERKRLENIARKRAAREAVEKKAAADKHVANELAASKVAELLGKVAEENKRTQEETRAALSAKLEALPRQLAEQRRLIADRRAPPATPAGGLRAEHIEPVRTRDPLPVTNKVSTKKGTAVASTAQNSERRGSNEGGSPTEKPTKTKALLNRARNDDGSPRRGSNDSGIGMPKSAATDNSRPIKVPTGPRRRVSSSSDDDRGMVPRATKRPAGSLAGTEERSKRPRASIPASASASASASPKSPAADLPATPSGSIVDLQPPSWYSALAFVPKRGEADAAVEPLLKTLRTKIGFCKDPRNMSGPRDIQQKAFNDIRRRIHELVFQTVNEKLLRNNSMLHNDRGLPQLFVEQYSGGVKWPFDIKADAKELYWKWCNRVFETDLLRGIIPGGGKSGGDRSSDKLDDNWPYRVNPRFHGNGQLVNGQWWPTQLAALRDGAHGSSQGGIYGESGGSAYSCIMAGNHDYADKDDGDKDDGEVVYYCGTDSFDGKVTAGTKHMIASCADGEPVRSIRSHKVQSKYAPEMGLRYDGLYDVVSYERLDPEFSLRQRHRFKLVRRSGQDPIRGGHGPEKRPTQQECEAHQKDKRLRGIGGAPKALKGKKGEVFPTWG